MAKKKGEAAVAVSAEDLAAHEAALGDGSETTEEGQAAEAEVEVEGGELVEGEEVVLDETGNPVQVAPHQAELDRLAELKQGIESSYWELSMLLCRCYDESWYIELGYQTWGEFVNEGLQFSEKKAKQLISIQKWFGELKDKDREFIQSIGWTKARLLVGKVQASEIKKLRSQLKSKTYREIEAMFSNTPKVNLKGKDPADEKVTKTLKLTRDIADNFDRALQQAKDIQGTDKNEVALDSICTEFMTAVAGVQNREDLIRRLERSADLEIIAFDKKSGDLVFGAEALQRYLDSVTGVGEGEDGDLEDPDLAPTEDGLSDE